MRLNILFGGKAGQGPNILTNLLGETLVEKGYYVFYSRDYQSLIRGGHNFNVLTFSDKPTNSNDSELDIIIALDEETENIHKKELKKEGILLRGHKENMYYAGSLFKLLGFKFEELEKKLKTLEKKYEENLKNARQGYDEEKREINKLNSKKNKFYFTNGSKGISEGAVKSGLDAYYAYPMTPATSILMELAEKEVEKNYIVLELENEISVIGAAVGSAMTGAKAMVGTSGGGFDLMTEFLSLSGIAEIPLVIYLSQRPGPATGVPTYTAQGDLNIARHGGHGEFPRLVLAPGDPIECQESISQSFYFSQKYKIPVIVLSDKHLAESFYTMNEEAKITKSQKSTSLKKYNSYEHNNEGFSTEDVAVINANFEARLKKIKEIEKESDKFETFKIYGKRQSKNIIVSCGSTKGAILDAIDEIDCSFLQIIYIEPFAEKIKSLLDGRNIVLVENNATAQLGSLITEKTGIFIEEKNKILRYDGRPFFADELNKEIKKRIK
jgi:2-oxoglutarate/2-oxoacid ferredoxin oxidoreductase subunit alpha